MLPLHVTKLPGRPVNSTKIYHHDFPSALQVPAVSTKPIVCSIIANHLPIPIDGLQVQEALVAVVSIVHASIYGRIVAMVGIIPVGLIAVVRPGIYESALLSKVRIPPRVKSREEMADESVVDFHGANFVSPAVYELVCEV